MGTTSKQQDVVRCMAALSWPNSLDAQAHLVGLAANASGIQELGIVGLASDESKNAPDWNVARLCKTYG